MFVKELNLTLVFFVFFVFGVSAQNIKVIDNKGTLQTFNPWRLNGNIGITEPLVPAIYGTSAIGSAQNFLGTTDNKALVFGTNNIERLRINTLGQVGIGTASPAAQLHVKGDLGGILLERTAGTAPYDQGFLKMLNKDGGSFQLRSISGADDGFRITNGNSALGYIFGTSVNYLPATMGSWIGIGIETPVGKLIVNDLNYIANIPTTSANLADNSTYRPLVRFQTTSGSFNNAFSHYLTTTAAATQAHNYSTGTALPYVLQPAGGNVGIGTIAPANKLEIKHGTAGNSGLRFTNLTSSSSASISSNKVLTLNSLGDVILANVPGTQNIVDFSTATPTTSGVVFTPNTPADESVVYQSAVDNSLWTYNGTAYVTYNAPASTAWYTAGTTNDAGNSKTSNIYRTGNVGIGINNPSTKLHLQGIQATLGANANAMLRMSRPTWSGFKWGSVAQFNLGTYDDGVNPVNSKSRLDLALTNGNDETTLSNVMTWLANGNVGINNTTPSAPLVVQGVTGTGALKLIAPSVASGDNWWIGFGHGTTSTDANDRARIGAEIIAGGAGRLFFTTGATGTQTRAMFIDESQRVGIGTSTPTAKLVVRGANNSVSALGTAQTNAIFRIDGDSNHALDMGTLTASPYGSYIQSHNKASTTSLPLNINPVGGNVGIGTLNPRSALEVNGSATNSTAYNAASGTTIDFSLSNLAYTTASPGAFSLNNLRNGGTYTLAVQGSTSGTASFSSAGFTFLSVNNGPTIAGKQTLYTFIVMGTTVYYYMASGF